MSGAEAVQRERMGTYTKVADLMQGERPLYQRVGSTVEYLFYWPSGRRWVMGNNYTSNLFGLLSANTAAACPDQATGWQAYNSGAWVSTYPINVVQNPAGNAPATITCGPDRVQFPSEPASRAHFTAASKGCMPASTVAQSAVVALLHCAVHCATWQSLIFALPLSIVGVVWQMAQYARNSYFHRFCWHSYIHMLARLVYSRTPSPFLFSCLRMVQGTVSVCSCRCLNQATARFHR